MKIKSIFALALFLISFAAISQELSIKMDGVSISFLAEKQNTSGSVSGFKAKINFNVDDLSKSSISGTVDVNTIDTGNKKRDEHLKSADYFEATKYPTMSFTSKSFEKDGDKFVMKGILKIKEKEHEETIVFSFKDNVFRGEASIQLSNYDVGDFSTAKKNGVKISFEIPVM